MKKAILLLILLMICPTVLGTVTIQWTATEYTGTANYQGNGIAVDSSGNTYVAGRADFRIFKYGPTGAYVWNYSITGVGFFDRAEDNVVDSQNNLITVGDVGGGPVLVKLNSTGNQICNSTSYTSSSAFYGVDVDNSDDIYAVSQWLTITPNYPLLTKYNSTCNFQWNISFGNASTVDTFRDVAVDTGNNALAVGSLNSGAELFIVKVNSGGTQVWNRTISTGTYRWNGQGIATDSSDNVIVAGILNWTGVFPPTGYEGVFIIKYNSAGTQLWNTTFNASTYVTTTTDRAGMYDVAVDSAGDIIVGGYVYVSSNGYPSRWYLKFNSTGNYQWDDYFGGVTNTTSYDVAIKNTTNFVSTGVYKSWTTEEYGESGPSPSGPVPEFSITTLLLATLLVGAAIFAIRKRYD